MISKNLLPSGCGSCYLCIEQEFSWMKKYQLYNIKQNCGIKVSNFSSEHRAQGTHLRPKYSGLRRAGRAQGRRNISTPKPLNYSTLSIIIQKT